MKEPEARSRAYDLMTIALKALGITDDSALRPYSAGCVEDADLNNERHGYISVGYDLTLSYTSFGKASDAAHKVHDAWVAAGHISTGTWTWGSPGTPEPMLSARSVPDGFLMGADVNTQIKLRVGVSSPCFQGPETAKPAASPSAADAKFDREDGGSTRIRDILG